MKKISTICCICVLAACENNSTYVPHSTYTSPFDRPIDNTEMLCKRIDVNNIINDNIVCTDARVGDYKGSFFTTYSEVVSIPSEALFLKDIYDKKLENPNEIRDAAFKICTIRVFHTMNESLHKKSYCECSAEFVYSKLQTKKTVKGKDVLDLFTKSTSYKKDPLGINVVHENCRDKLDRYMTYDNTYREFYDDCVKVQKESKETCDQNTRILLSAVGITKNKGIWMSDWPSDSEFSIRVRNIISNQ